MKLMRLWLLILLKALVEVEAATVKHKWEIKYAYRYPDCYKRLALTVNGMIPGPPIEAVQGDTVVVEVKNSLYTENVAIHWHGIRQMGTPWSDGTEGITQCGLQPRDTIVYKFVVDRPGTYMYHSHSVMQLGEGLYGMIRVNVPPGVSVPFNYTDDQQILLSDWYHQRSSEQATGLSSNPFVWVGPPDSILMHGRGRFNCHKPGTEARLCNATNPQCSPHILKVDPGKTIRLRIGSLASLSILSFEIEGHEMTVVEADGSYVEPFTVKHLYIHNGETFSVLVSAKQDPSRNYWMVAKPVGHPDETPSGLGILNYSPNPPSHPSMRPPKGPMWNYTKDRKQQSLLIKAHHDYIIPPPKTPERVLFLLNRQMIINGQLRWGVNNVTLSPPGIPLLIAMKQKLLPLFNHTHGPANFDIGGVPNIETLEGNGIVGLRFNSTVDVILQNADTINPGNESQTHPWHLHRHAFWVLAHGDGRYDHLRDRKKYNLDNPIMKNTVPLYPFGWVVLRFQANNPGVWAFHCHVESHLFMGMSLVFVEGIDKVGDLPTSIMSCGGTKSSYATRDRL